jgi:AraC family transcriptional regulator
VSFGPANCGEDFHVGHRDVGGYNVVHNHYPSGHRIGEHEHDSATLYLVLRGNHSEVTRGKTVECGKGSVVFSPLGARHSDRYGTAGGEAFLIELPDAVLDRAREGGVRLEEPCHIPGGSAAELMRRLYEEAERDDVLSPLAFEGLLFHLLATLQRERARIPASVPVWLTRTRELLNDRFNERISLGEVAAIAGVHPVHFATTFHRYYGITFGAHLRSLRVEHARRALRETDKAIAEIALECGFFDQSHLSRVFRDATGLSPARFRRIARH